MSTPLPVRRSRPWLASVLVPILAPSAASQSFAYVHGGVGQRCESLADNDAWFSFEGGVIRYTDDGGLTIRNADVPENVRGALHGFHMSRDPLGPWGYCVGDDGVVLFSDNAGATWAQMTVVMTPAAHPYNPDIPAPLWDVWFTSRDHGYVVGYENTIQETNDGGVTWVPLAPTSGHLAVANPEWYQLHGFANGDFVAVGDHGWTVHRTASTGALLPNTIDSSLWCYLPAGSPPWDLELWGVDFVGDVGIAVAGIETGDGHVFRSTDAGKTWATDTACFSYLPLITPGTVPPAFYGVDLFGDADRGVVVGYASMALLGGPSSSATAAGGCMQCPPGSKAWTQAVCDSDQNPGADPEDDTAQPLLRGVCSSTSFQRGYALGDFGVVRRTDNQGVTWSELQGLHRGRIQCGAFADMQIGVVGGQLWRVFSTVDGGQHFSLDYVSSIPPGTPSGNFNGAAIAADGGRAVVVGDRGRIAVRDDNNTWFDRSIGAWANGPQLNATLASASGLVMLVAGQNFGGGTLRLSTDGGATPFTALQLTWQGQPVNTMLTDLAFDGTFVYYLAANNRVYIADPAASLTAAIAVVPIVGSTGVPICLRARSITNFFAGNDHGQVFRVDVATATMTPVAAIAPADLGGYAFAIAATPGSAEWWFTGASGHVVRFDGSDPTQPAAFTQPKSSIADNVVDVAFFAGGDGLLIGRKINIATW